MDIKAAIDSMKITTVQWSTDPPITHFKWLNLVPKDTMNIIALYEHTIRLPSDIQDHLQYLRDLAAECATIVELGIREGVSTIALARGLIDHNAKPKQVAYRCDLWCVDIFDCSAAVERVRAACEGRIDVKWVHEDSRKMDPVWCDMLMIDTLHRASQLREELAVHAEFVERYIVMHDTETYGRVGDDRSPGLMYAVEEFLAAHPEWEQQVHFPFCHGLTVLARVSSDEDEHNSRKTTSRERSSSDVDFVLPDGHSDHGPSADVEAVVTDAAIKSVTTTTTEGR